MRYVLDGELVAVGGRCCRESRPLRRGAGSGRPGRCDRDLRRRPPRPPAGAGRRGRRRGCTSTVVTFDPHPRTALGNRVELLTTLERRLELIAESRIEDVLVVEFTLDVARLEPEEFAEQVLWAIGTKVIVAGENFRFGRARRGDLDLLRDEGFDVRTVPFVEQVSSSQIRKLLHGGEVGRAASLLGRAYAIEGVVVTGDARGGTLGFPTANVAVDSDLLIPASASTRARPRATVRRSRSARTRTTAATSSGSRRSCSTSRATSTASGSGRALAAAPRRARLRQRGGAGRADRSGRRGDPRDAAAGLTIGGLVRPPGRPAGRPLARRP